MRRNILLALVAALALAIGLSNVAAADPGAGASAKAGKKGKRGKGKACKGKRGKGRSRGKARRSAGASAKARKGRKGKGKRRGCKGGGANWLELGKYQGQGVIEVDIRSRKRVGVRLPEAPATCIPGVAIGIEVEDAKLTANRLIAKFIAPPGTRGLVKRMELVVTPDYRYKLVVDSDGNDVGFACSKSGTTFQGKLKKVG